MFSARIIKSKGLFTTSKTLRTSCSNQVSTTQIQSMSLKTSRNKILLKITKHLKYLSICMDHLSVRKESKTYTGRCNQRMTSCQALAKVALVRQLETNLET